MAVIKSITQPQNLARRRAGSLGTLMVVEIFSFKFKIADGGYFRK